MKKLLLASALIVFVGAFQSGCVVGRRTIALPVPAAATATAPAQKGTVYLEAVTDDRRFENKPAEPSTPSIDGDVNEMSAEQRSMMIGRQRGGFGNAMGDIALPAGENVQKRVTALFEEALKRRGYALSTDAAAANKAGISIKEFWAWFTPGMWSVSFEARISCVLSVTTPAGVKEITVTSQSYNGGQVASDANWQIAYTRAFEDFLKKLDAELATAGL
jgi:uncharacterized lipoprotein YajG